LKHVPTVLSADLFPEPTRRNSSEARPTIIEEITLLCCGNDLLLCISFLIINKMSSVFKENNEVLKQLWQEYNPQQEEYL
jgi:hypothetical protein